MEPVTSKLRRTRLFANLPDEGLADLISAPGVQHGELAEVIDARPGDLVVLLEGGLHMTSQSGEGEHLAILSVNEAAPEPAILYTIPAGAVLRLTRFSTYLVINGAELDLWLSAPQEQRSLSALDATVRERTAALIDAGPFPQLTFDQIVRGAEAMQTWDVTAGEDIVVEGEPGEFFYVIESGLAEVVRNSGASPGALSALARLGPGAAFGEEALLRSEPRNATVRMVTDGRLLRLSREDFDRLLRSELVSEMDAATAIRLIERREIEIVDCRTEEWDLWRLPNARLIPLEEIRDRARGLEKSRRYLVYCRTGRRSSAATFLMRQMGLDAHVLTGGLSDWPHEVEGVPMDG